VPPPGTAPISERIAREIAKRKRKIKIDIENATFLHYPKEEVLGVLKFWASSWARRRSRGATAELPDRDAELTHLIGEIVILGRLVSEPQRVQVIITIFNEVSSRACPRSAAPYYVHIGYCTLRGRRMDDEYKIINSPQSQKITRDGTTIEVLIYRGEHEAAWILEVVDHAGGSTVWDETFQTEQAALNEVLRTIDEEGIACFLLDPVQKLH
jgi:hypothetical protein